MIRNEIKPEPSQYKYTRPLLWGSEYILTKWLDRIQIGTLEVQFPSGCKRIFTGPIDGPGAKINIHKINSRKTRKGYDKPKSTVGKLSASKLQICLVYFCKIYWSEQK